MPAVMWWVFGFGLYLLGAISVLGLMRGVARSDEFEAGVRASWPAPPSGPGAPRPRI